MTNTTWISAWGNAVSIAEHHPQSYAKDITLRYPVYLPFSGEALRFTFDNYCGSEPVVISGATISVAAFSLTEKAPLSCDVTAKSICNITFDGKIRFLSAHTRLSSVTRFPFPSKKEVLYVSAFIFRILH